MLKSLMLFMCGTMLSFLFCSALSSMYGFFGWQEGIMFWTMNIVSYPMAILLVKYILYKFGL